MIHTRDGRSEASNVSERSEVPSVTGDFLWGYFFYLAPPHFFYRGGSRFFYPSHFFLLGDSKSFPHE